MLEKPQIEDRKIIASLSQAYGLSVEAVTFLPVGADQDTAAYRAVSVDGDPFFVKLRRGDFVAASVAVPNTLHDLGVWQVIPAVTTQTGGLWTGLDSYKLVLYPYITGQNGYDAALSNQHRVKFGEALKKFHSTDFPEEITRGVRWEAFPSKWREKLRTCLERAVFDDHHDPLAAELAAFLVDKWADTLGLLERATQLAEALQAEPSDFILCHGDIHAWNLLVDAGGNLYMVDWDTLVWAPKERDLMFVGGGLGGIGCTLQDEVRLFYQGYGHTEINLTALAYYRCERIIEDLAIYCGVIFDSNDGGADRRQSLVHLKSNYLPGGTLEIAVEAI